MLKIFKFNIGEIKEYFAESSYYVEDENEVVLGKKVQLKVDSKKKSPVHSIYWAAINQTQSAKTKSLCFYAENMSESPIKCTKIEKACRQNSVLHKWNNQKSVYHI